MNWYDLPELWGPAEIMICNDSSWNTCRNVVQAFSESYGGKSRYMDFDSDTNKIGFRQDDELIEHLNSRTRQLIVSSGQYKLNVKFEQNIAMFWIGVKDKRFPMSNELKPLFQSMELSNNSIVLIIGYEIDPNFGQIKELFSGKIPATLGNDGLLSIIVRMSNGKIMEHDFFHEPHNVRSHVNAILNAKLDMLSHLFQ